MTVCKKMIFMLLSSLLLFGACQEKEVDVPLVLFQETGTISTLHDAVESVQIIRLENNDAVFGSINDVFVVDGDYYIVDNENQRLLRYDSEGRFICEFGRRGRGPGEFNNLLNVQIHKDTVIIYSVPEMTELLYDKNGNYLLTRTEEIHGVQFFHWDNGILAFHGYGTSNCKLTFWENGKHMDYFPYTTKVVSFLDKRPVFSEDESSVFIRDPFEKTIFRFAQGKMVPWISFDFGPYSIDESFFSMDFMESAEYIMESDICLISRYYETADYRFIEVDRPLEALTYYGVANDDHWIWFNAGIKSEAMLSGRIKAIDGNDLICLVERSLLLKIDTVLRDKLVEPDVLSNIDETGNDVIIRIKLAKDLR